MKVVGPAVVVLVVLLASAVEAQEGGGVAPSWLALGDSYASGEGISGTDPDGDSRQFHSGDCARANGNTDAKAWSVVAYEQVWGGDERSARMWFTACSGHITDDWEAQVGEASFRWNGSQPVRVDVVSLSFGGNNILFSDVIKGCLDVGSVWDAVTAPGCDVDLDELRYRIDLLAGNRSLTEQDLADGRYRGLVALPALYDRVAELVNQGGHVFVAGYPQLVEETGRWDPLRRRFLHNCEGIDAGDVGMLRSAAGYLNEQIGRAVLAADERYPNITFQFVDLASQVYETGDRPDQRHALCSEDPWLNGQTVGITSGDFRLTRSFHPHQAGHTATGQHLGLALREIRHSTESGNQIEWHTIERRDEMFAFRLVYPQLGRSAIDQAILDYVNEYATAEIESLDRVTAGEPDFYAPDPEYGVKALSNLVLNPTFISDQLVSLSLNGLETYGGVGWSPNVSIMLDAGGRHTTLAQVLTGTMTLDDAAQSAVESVAIPALIVELGMPPLSVGDFDGLTFGISSHGELSVSAPPEFFCGSACGSPTAEVPWSELSEIVGAGSVAASLLADDIQAVPFEPLPFPFEWPEFE